MLFSATLALAAAQDPCDVFSTMACPIIEVNLMGTYNNITETTVCQNR